MAQRPSYVANFLPGLLAEGHSGASALRSLREGGHSIGTSEFYRLWGETQSHLAQQEEFVATPLNRVPSAAQIGTATRPRARGYLYNVEIAVHNTDSGEVNYHSWGVRSKKLISIGKALRTAIDTFQAAIIDEQDKYPYRLLGGFVSSVLDLVPPAPEIATGE